MELHGTPLFINRAYQLDISRDRVPTLDTLAWLIGVLGELRYTELHLYIEHTFTYEGHEAVWRDASPLTRDDLTWVRDHAAAAGLTLVANLNCFGHMERWLRVEEHRHRAECPDGFPSPFGSGTSPPTCLAPTPENAEFAVGLARELLDVVGGDRIMIGGDEPFELGRCRSRNEAARIGRDRLYREHLGRIVGPLLDDGVEVMIWGDQFRRDPTAIEWVPDGVTLVPWNYEAPGRGWASALPNEIVELLGLPDGDERGFEAHVELMADAGLPFRVAAGTGSWNSLIGRNANAAANIDDAARVGAERGATGFMLCDWGDKGHWQPLAVSLPSIVRAAAAAWRGSSQNLEVGAVIDRLLDAEPGTGELLDRLGHLGESLGATTANGTPIGAAVLETGFPTVGRVDHEDVRDAIGAIDDAANRWAGLLHADERGHIIAEELVAIGGAARLALQRLGGEETTAADVDAVRSAQAAAWRRSSRHGGLDDSLHRLR